MNPLVRAGASPWTIEDLERLPDDGNRYELFDGSLLVSPHANVQHSAVILRLRRLIDKQLPAGLVAGQDFGVNLAHRTTYYVPDLVVIDETALARPADSYLAPTDVLVVVEVLSPGNKGRDLVLKRNDYARAGIQTYWIVDPDEQTLTILDRGPDGAYVEIGFVRAGEHWHADQPFPVSLDPADFCQGS